MWQRRTDLTTTPRSRCARAPFRWALIGALASLTGAAATAGVDTYKQDGRRGGSNPAPSSPSAQPANSQPTMPWERGSGEETLTASVSVSPAPGRGATPTEDGADDSASAEHAPAPHVVDAVWVSPPEVLAVDGYASLIVRVDESSQPIRAATFVFDGPVRVGSTTSRRHRVDEALLLDLDGQGVEAPHYILDVELLSGQPRNVHAILAFDGSDADQPSRVPGARRIDYQRGERREGDPIFLWCPSGEFGPQIDLSGTPIELDAVIFYVQHIGHYPYLWEGHRINGVVPQAVDLDAHLRQALLDIHEHIPDPDWSGYAVLDFEPWFAGWEWCPDPYKEESRRLVRAKHPDLDEADVERLAIAEFERAAEDFLLETLRLCQRERPDAKWGFYGYPYAKELSASAGRVLAEVDALYPNAYMTFRTVGDDVKPGRGETFARWSRASITNRVQNARRVAGDRPVITFTWLLYHNLNDVYRGQLLRKPDLELMLRTPIEAGADGLLIWGHLTEKDVFDRQQRDLRRRVTPILMDLLRDPQP